MKAVTKIVIVVFTIVFILNFSIWSILTQDTNTLDRTHEKNVLNERPSTQHNTNQRRPTATTKNGQICTEVDVVYTWVNGSDPVHKKTMTKYGGGDWDGGYRDYGVIRYSIRSVEKFMPWVRNIIIVTNGQIPGWANVSSPKLRIVSHDQIFENKDNLPTFNSNAIEANLYNIPGLAPCFLYLNDDMFVGMPIEKSTFFDENGHLQLHMSRGFIAPMVEKMKHNTWHKSVGHSNEIINKYYYPDATEPVKHPYAAHTCYFMRKDILQTMHERWKTHFDYTSTHRFRKWDDTAIPFMQANVALEEFGAKSVDRRDIFGTWTKNSEKNENFWKRIWEKPNMCVCMNDGLDNSKDSLKEIDHLKKLFEEKFPNPSSVELHY